jgi:hypothetical protein
MGPNMARARNGRFEGVRYPTKSTRLGRTSNLLIERSDRRRGDTKWQR